MKRWAGLAFAAAVLAGPLAAPAWAHADIERADPTPCSAVATAGEARLVFGDELDSATSSITVSDASGNQVASGSVDLFDLDHTSMVATPSTSLPVGLYELEWVVTSAVDGDVTTGSYQFAIGNPRDPDVLALLDTETCGLVEGESSSTGWLPVAVGVIGSAGLLAAFWHTTRSRPVSQPV